MISTQGSPTVEGLSWQTKFPRLATLRLTDEDIVSLRSQGSVRAEHLPSGSTCHKLRFRDRRTKRMKVRYLGTDMTVRDAVRQELAALQSARRRERELKRLEREARGLLRAVKMRLAPILAEAGIEFCGYEPRFKRGRVVVTERRDAALSCVDSGNEVSKREEIENEYGRETETTDTIQETAGLGGTPASADSRVRGQESQTAKSTASKPWCGGQQSDVDGPSASAGDRGFAQLFGRCDWRAREGGAGHGYVPKDYQTMGPSGPARSADRLWEEERKAGGIELSLRGSAMRRTCDVIPTWIIAGSRGPP